MEVIISPLVSALIENLAPKILRQAGRIWGSEIETELQKLRDALCSVEVTIQLAEERQVLEGAARRWLETLKDAVQEADDLIEDFELQFPQRKRKPEDVWFRRWGRKVCVFFSCRNSQVFLLTMGPEIKRIVERINGLAAPNFTFQRTNTTVATTLTCGFVEESDVVGRVEEESYIVEKLLGLVHQPGISVIPIVGMGGIGKTTLANKVYHAPRMREHFELRMSLKVTPHGFAPLAIANAMIEAATEQGFQHYGKETLQSNLRKLIGAKRYLLVLDDVWNEKPQPWDELKDLLTFGAHGSCVLVTTRSRKVASLMGSSLDHVYQLKSLSEDDCWELFKRRAFRGGEEPPNLVNIGRAIVKKCDGLPLAAKALGSLMPGMTGEQWKAVLKSEIWDREFEDSGILPALMLSYSHLPSDIKQCFAFCSIFPKGHEIEKETLIRLWTANRYLALQTDQVLSGNTIFRLLEQKSFFQEVKVTERWYDGNSITTFKMHDLIHDVARYVAGTNCSTLDNWEDISTSKSRHLLVNYGGNSGTKTETGRNSGTKTGSNTTLRTLIFKRPQNDHPLPQLLMTWSNTKYLRVLTLNNMGFTEFPTTICELRHLRYLDLSRNKFETIPEAFDRLAYLQILDLSACDSLLGLPKCIVYMVSLVHLYLEGCGSLRCMPAGMGQLNQLQTLTKYVPGTEAGSGTIRELIDLDIYGVLELCNLQSVIPDTEEDASSILGTKENLDTLVLDWGKPAVDEGADAGSITADNTSTAVLQSLQPHQNLKHLNIRHYQGTEFPPWLMGQTVLSNLVEVTLAECNGSDYLPQLGQLPSLEVLQIIVMKSVKTMLYSGAAFSLLRKLKLEGMHSLEEWSTMGAEGRAFPSVTDIELNDCPKLMIMPVLPSVRRLKIKNCPLLRPSKGFFGLMTSLERLELESCDIVTLQLELEDGPPMHSLNSLTIKRCQELMFSSQSVGMWRLFRSLENLNIFECDGLVILPIDVLGCWTSLKKFTIHNCHSLVGSSSEEIGLEFRDLPELEVLDIQVCTLFPCFLPEGLKNLTGLKTMRIYSNHGLTELPDFSDSLREVTIYNCWNLISLPVGLGRLPEFERLVLLNLNKVDSLPDGSYQTLKTLMIDDCKKLLSFPPGLLNRLPELKYLEIKNSPALEKLCSRGGPYWSRIEQIPTKAIGN